MSAKSIIKAGVKSVLRITNGKMPVRMLLPDQTTADFAEVQARGRHRCGALSFEVSDQSRYPSIERPSL